MKSILRLIIATGILAAGSSLANGGMGNDLDLYFIGNSLTRNLSLDRLEWLFTQASGELDYGSQLSGGVNLHEHWFRDRDSAQPWRENTLENQDYGNYPKALQSNSFNALVFQPYLYWLETDADDYAGDTNKIGERVAISNFITYALGDNPSSNIAAQRFFVYGTWPRLLGIHYRNPDTPTPAVLPEYGNTYTGYTFTSFYNEPYSKNVRWGQASQTVPTRDFCTQLVERLNENFPGLPAPVRFIPAGDVFAALDGQIRSGTLPGLEEHLSRPDIAAYYANARKDDTMGSGTNEIIRFPIPTNTPFSAEHGIVNFYCDQVHMNDQPHNGPDEGCVGSYVAALTIYATVTGESPVGLPATDGTNGWEKFDPVDDAELIEALQNAVWNTVINDPYSGVVPEPGSALGATGLAAAATLLNRLR